MSNIYQMSNARFIEYTDDFAEAALSGTYAADPVLSSVDIVKQVDVNTFTEFPDAVQARNQLVNDLEETYEQINIDARSISPMSASFAGLADHIREHTGMSIDEYLTDQGLKVNSTYAAIYGNISESNIA